MNFEDAICFKNRREWRRWLVKNHAKEGEIWLAHYKKHSEGTGVRLEEAVEEAICFGWIDGKLRSLDGERFALRYTPRRRGSVWSGRNKATAMKLMEQGRMTKAGVTKIDEAKRNGRWASAYSSRKQPQIPEDLETALSRSEISWRNFKRFSKTQQAQYIFWIDNARRIDTRKERIKSVVRWARLGKRSGDSQA